MNYAIELLEREMKSECEYADYGYVEGLPDGEIKNQLKANALKKAKDYQEAISILKNSTGSKEANHD